MGIQVKKGVHEGVQKKWVNAGGFQRSRMGCWVARGDFAVEDQTEFGVGDPSKRAQVMHFAKKG